MIWQAIQTVISIFLMIGIGVFIAWRKWASAEVIKALPLIIINIAMPGTIIYSLSSELSRQLLYESWLPLLIIFFVMGVSFLLGKLAAVIFKIPSTRRGVFSVLFSLSNSVFIGFPVALALFGNPGMPFAVFYYLSNTMFFWTLGYFAIRKDADMINGISSNVTAGDVLKKLITTPFVTIIIMFVVILLGITLPDIIITTTKYLNGLTSPLSLIFMGCLVYGIGPKCISYEKGIGPILVGRFIITPTLCFTVCTLAIIFFSAHFKAIDMTLMRNVFTLQTGLPAMATTAIVSDLYGADAGYATKGFFWTTIFSLISIPAYMLLFQYL